MFKKNRLAIVIVLILVLSTMAVLSAEFILPTNQKPSRILKLKPKETDSAKPKTDEPETESSQNVKDNSTTAVSPDQNQNQNKELPDRIKLENCAGEILDNKSEAWKCYVVDLKTNQKFLFRDCSEGNGQGKEGECIYNSPILGKALPDRQFVVVDGGEGGASFLRVSEYIFSTGKINKIGEYLAQTFAHKDTPECSDESLEKTYSKECQVEVESDTTDYNSKEWQDFKNKNLEYYKARKIYLKSAQV